MKGIRVLAEIRTLAIVNRGEAATRCIRAVQSLRAREGCELEVIALYTEPDKGAPFVQLLRITYIGARAGKYPTRPFVQQYHKLTGSGTQMTLGRSMSFPS